MNILNYGYSHFNWLSCLIYQNNGQHYLKFLGKKKLLNRNRDARKYLVLEFYLDYLYPISSSSQNLNYDQENTK